jgi:hypothetical protein
VNVVETPRKKESSMTLTAIGVIAVAAVAGAAFYVIKHKKD